MRLPNPVHLWAICSSILLWMSCTQTREVQVRVPVPVPVEIRQVCPVSLPELPQRPQVADPDTCHRAFGSGAICFNPVDAIRLAQLLKTLSGLYADRKACEPLGDGNKIQPSPDMAPGAAGPDGRGSAGGP